ncbi:3-phenylpropionate/trans-cinnamate dioxygenase ferredoxin reductase subunit [Brevibacterium sanguinis]|uniref:3-phenylpropionate/trans-cinnamate dioxygenase ferredoxin reductase subunit n=2 Tax=Brevibacterium TaxID=1696 RepID=A0A366IJX6_9MICO|nr:MULTISPECIES: FAD-dependent oxidoreductase [Brevibacterium]RBP64269.1 3-phenylpropionate/trans-cinnamate dioxygenase ferredoxin reductase subunit [Brevibacterium sanguinis]RBP71439.1 3-phenylpropionate/trans-cinnamate dioxygenase ferredoxin reductase subunit [Brevibacterium celere]
MAQEFGTVVIGAGIGGGHVVKELREQGYDKPIALVGSESLPPYHRPDLSKKVLVEGADTTELGLEEEGWYAEHDITTYFGTDATGIDAAAHTVELGSGETLRYEKLVLATGSVPHALDLPGAALDNVITLRDADDAEAIRARFAEGANVVIIGGGWIGLEVAAAAKVNGCTVTVLLRSTPPLRAALGEEIGQYFADLHARNGVVFRTDATTTGFSGAGTVSGVETDNGSIPADLVVIGIGAAPATSLAEAAGLTVDDGVVVDEHLVTSDPDILAIGDIADAPNTLLGRRLRVEHWDNAVRQAAVAAATIRGHQRSYDWQPYFYTDQFDLGMEYVGTSAPDDDVVIRGEKSSGEFIVFWTRDDTVTAAMNVNIWDSSDELRALVGKSVPASRLQDTSIPVGEL